ncbi:hypothetical protein [Streptomyces sp. NPDC051554]|uniref:hypothetical protein n=1 Tax=Streptomyces sp. NPDC051554 TaxID=3365656 RepID=UPI00379277B7
MTLHAIEITLTRSVGSLELAAAQHRSRLSLAASADRSRLAVLVTAKDERRAVRKIWKRLQDALPIDVLCTLFPAPDGTYLMSIPLTHDAQERIRSHALAAGKSPEQHLHDAVLEALVRDRSTHREQLECSLNQLLHDFTPEEITAAAARRITSHPVDEGEGPS